MTLFDDTSEVLRKHSQAKFAAFHSWQFPYMFEQSTIPELQQELQELLQPFDIKERFSAFLQADTSSPEACSDAKERLFELTGLRSAKVPASVIEDINTGTAVRTADVIPFLDMIKERAQQRGRTDIVAHFSDGEEETDDAVKGDAMALKIKEFVDSEPDLASREKELLRRVQSERARAEEMLLDIVGRRGV